MAQSLLQSRLKYYGNKDEFFSGRPREYVWLKQLPYPQQIAGQIYCIRRRLDEAFATMPPERSLVVDYEALCARPLEEIERPARTGPGPSVRFPLFKAAGVSRPLGRQPAMIDHGGSQPGRGSGHGKAGGSQALGQTALAGATQAQRQ